MTSTWTRRSSSRPKSGRWPAGCATTTIGRGAARRAPAGGVADVGTDPEALHFCDGTDGKPELVGRPDRPSVRSQCLAFRFGDPDRRRRRPRGRDRRRADPDVVPMGAGRAVAFLPAELESIRRSSDARRVRAFFDCWVRKEAYLKGLGQGLVRSTRYFRGVTCPGRWPGPLPLVRRRRAFGLARASHRRGTRLRRRVGGRRRRSDHLQSSQRADVLTAASGSTTAA